MKVISVIIYLFNISFLYSQTDYYCVPKQRFEITTNPQKPINREFPGKLNTKFDWTIDSIRYRPAYYTHDTVMVAMPFYQYNNPRNYELSQFHDILPEDGWELIRFGGEFILGDSNDRRRNGWPYFVLYNKYTGILREFVLLEPRYEKGYNYLINFVGIYDDYDWKNSMSSVFDNIQPQNALDNLNDYTRKFYYPLAMGKDMWNWGDIKTTYDPCSCGFNDQLIIYTNIYRYRDVVVDGKQGIEYSEFLFNTPIFALPGSDLVNSGYNKDAIDAWYPLYNNTLGTFNLLRTPEINYSIRLNQDYEYQFKLERDLDFVLNPAACYVMDSVNLFAKYVVEFRSNPDIRSDSRIYKINDSTYESSEIPIGCFKDFTFHFSSPFSEPPNRIYIKLSGDFQKLSKAGSFPSQYLEKNFSVNLTNRNDIEFLDNFWQNDYFGECTKQNMPFNLNNDNIRKFCNGEEYIKKERYSEERKTRKIIDTVAKYSKQIEETRLYDIYPNPASSIMNIEYSIVNQSDIKLYLIDVLGKKVAGMEIKGNLLRGKHKSELNISHLSQGIYIVIFETNGKKDSRKIIVLR